MGRPRKNNEQTKAPASPVQPIQAVRTRPGENNEEAEVVTVHNQPNLQDGREQFAAPIQPTNEHPGFQTPKKPKSMTHCWNCDNKLNEKSVCDNCGFKLDHLYNPFLETDKRRHEDAINNALEQY